MLEGATWEPHCGAGGARMAEAKKADLGPLGSAPSKPVTSPGCFSPGPGEPLKIFFFHIYSSVGYHRLLFQLVGGVSDNRLISPVFLSLLSDRSLPDKGFMYIILICIFKVLLGLPRWR